MAMGDANNKEFTPTYYVKAAVKNQQTRLSPSYKNGLMYLNLVSVANGKYENITYIAISPTKARLAAIAINSFKKDLEEGNAKEGAAYGIDTGINDVRPAFGIVLKDGAPNIFIGRVKPDGTWQELFYHQINQDYHYDLKWDNLEQQKVSKEYFNMVEIDEICVWFEEFARNASGAVASSVWGMVNVDTRTLSSLVDAAASKLGCERKSYGGNKSTGKSYFDNRNSGNNGSTTRSSLDDLEEELG